MSLTQEQIAERDASAKSIVESWYWQAAEGHNYRNANAAKTMTLFYESAPLESDILKLVIEWLRTRTGLTQLVVNHKDMTFETGWDAADAWFATAPGEKWQGTESNRVRIYWVLVQAGDATGDGFHIVEDGCRYKVEHKFFWDVKTVPTLEQSGSGVSYTIQGLTRDRQTGLYSYVIEKRSRIQQDVAEYTSSITQFEEQKVEQHIGVDQQHEASAGQAASVSDGTIVERIEEKNDDCTKNITNRKRIEKEVDDAQVTTQKTLRGKRTRILHRNQTAAHATAKVPATIPDGTTVIQEKTPGKRTDITIDQNEANENNTSISSGKEVSSGVAVETEVVSMPNADAATDAATQLTAEANKVKRRTYRKNEDGVTTDREISTTTYTERSGTGSTESGTAQTGGTTVETTRKINAVSPETIGQNEPAVNKVVEVDNSPNEHGSFTTLKRTTTYTERSGTGSTESGTAQTGGTTVETTRKINAATAETIGSGDRGVNKVVEVDNTPNDHGSFTTLKRTTTYTERSGTGSTESGTAQTGGTTVETTRKINAVSPETIGQNEPEVNKVVEVDNTPNEHGSFTTLKRTTTHNPQESSEITWSDDEYNYKRKSYRNQLAPLLPSETSGQKSISFTPNDHGSWNGEYLVRTAKVASDGNGIKIVQEGLDVRHSKARRYGHWQWTNGLNETYWYDYIWEYRRFATMRVKYIGLTEAQANALKGRLDELFTRSVTVSEWNGSGQSGGTFSDVSGGTDKMARVHTFHIEGSVWGVSVFVNETSVRLRATGAASASSVFSSEDNSWQYELPAQGTNE